VLELNLAAQQLLGKPAAELREKYLSLALPELYDHPNFSLESLSHGAELHLSDLQLPRATGGSLPLEVAAKSVPWHTGKAVLLTLRNQAVQQIQQQQQNQRSRLDASVMTMRGLAREISDALTSVRGNLDLLARQPFPRQESKDHVEDAQQGLRRIESYARKAAALTRLQEEPQLSTQRVPLKTLLEKSVAFALLDGHCNPVMDLNPNLWPLEGDPQLLNEAFLQLARNAARSMPPGGHLFVEAVNEPADPAQKRAAGLRITLRDEGHGVSPDDLPRIQDPFFSTWGREGLGLTTAAAILRAHGGTLELASKQAEGTTVTVRLPVNLKQLLQQGLAASESEGGQKSVLQPARGPQRILFMDDDPQIRSLVQKILAGQGLSVYCTNDGEEAIQAYRKAHQFGAAFDLIIMDLDVRGGMGGVEATQVLKREFPNIRAILATGYVDDNLLASHQDHGFLGVLLKPFEVERLLGLVAKLA
jgi:two-component system, cell cycle sensor histidine kinase and response regulator CckA